MTKQNHELWTRNFCIHHVWARAILCLAAIVFAHANATTVVPGDYAKSITITFPGYSGSETLSDFPVLVKLSAARNDFDYSACLVANGGDLRFADVNGNLLASEVDMWNTSGESLVWVKVPSFNKDTVITAYYGNANPPEVTASDVWSNGYVGVWHLNESSTPLADSSGKATPFKLPESTVDRMTYATNGVAGGKSVSFYNGYTDLVYRRLEAEDSPSLRGLTNFTVECWTYQTVYRDDSAATILGSVDNWKFTQDFPSNCIGVRWRRDATDTVWGRGTSFAPALNEWSYTTFVRDVNDDMTKAACKLYVNGSDSNTWTENDPKQTGNGSAVTCYLGGGDGIRVFPGSIDEARVSNVARSADWVKATHDCVVEEGFAFYATPGGNDWAKYSHKFKVAFSGYTGSETLVNFPALVKISESGIMGFRYADCKKPNGGDLRFSDSEGNLLASEVDTWNTNGVSLVWVKVPSLTMATRITAYYGWKLSPVVAVSNVWANGYVGVWHLNESAAPLADSSRVSQPFTAGEKYDLVNCGASGVVGKSVSFVEHYTESLGKVRLQAANDANLDGFKDFTVEYWLSQTQYVSSFRATILAKRGSDPDSGWFIYQMADGTLQPTWFNDAGKVVQGPVTPSSSVDGEWRHQAFIRDVNGDETEASLQWYFNGATVGDNNKETNPSMNASTVDLMLGVGGQGNIFPGSIDEIRISNVARSADWVKATHDTVTESSFATYGSARENVIMGTSLIFR